MPHRRTSRRRAGRRAGPRRQSSAAAILGLASVALPDVTGSVGWAGGALAAAWGVMVVAAAEWQMRQTKTTMNDPEGGQR